VKGGRSLKGVAKNQPATYLKVCAMLVPKELTLEPSGGIKAMSDEQPEAALDALRDILARRAAAAARDVTPALPQPDVRRKRCRRGVGT
jgi:hypothetical protein